MSKTIDIVIPVREGSLPIITVDSLKIQSFTDFRMIVVSDKWQNANKARNHGFTFVDAPYVLFADDDIKFHPQALEWLLHALETTSAAAYSYGAFLKGGKLIGNVPFNIGRLQRRNYISTMSLIRRASFPGFDESIKRLQDWDMFLTMLEKGHIGVFCYKTIFSTEPKEGISTGMHYADAEDIIKKKHNLPGGVLSAR